MAMSLDKEIARMRALFARHDNVPASLVVATKCVA